MFNGKKDEMGSESLLAVLELLLSASFWPATRKAVQRLISSRYRLLQFQEGDTF